MEWSEVTKFGCQSQVLLSNIIADECIANESVLSVTQESEMKVDCSVDWELT